MNTNEFGPKFDPIGTGSKAEFVRGVSQQVLDQMDLQTSTSRERILNKAENIQASAIFGGDQNTLRESFPTLDHIFKTKFGDNLKGKAEEPNEQITGAEIVNAYESAVDFVSAQTTRQLRQGMYMPDAYGNMLDYFGVPVSQDIIAKVENPALAEEYRQRAAEWTKSD